MSKLVNWGRRISRDCFLCYGGALVVIAIGGLLGNLPDIIRYRDWPPYQVDELYSAVSRFALFGVIFLAAAYAQFKSKRWGALVTAGVSASALAWMLIIWLKEPYDPEGFAIVLVFWATPLLFTLAWSLIEMSQQLTEARRNQIA